MRVGIGGVIFLSLFACGDNSSATEQCGDMVCDSPPSDCHSLPGTCNEGQCSYELLTGTDCDDGDACTEGDQCSAGVCSGEAVECSSPPAATCESNMAVSYADSGTCTADTCGYEATNTPCNCSCESGACTSVDWTTKTLASTGFVGAHASLSLYEESGLQLLVFHNDGQSLRYFQGDHAALIAGTDNGLDLGFASGMDLGRYVNGSRNYVLFYDGFATQLTGAVYDGSWSIGGADASADVGEYLDMALDSSGLPHASYYDADNQALRYITRATPWSSEFVENGNDNVGQHSSIALDASDGVHIAYHDATNGTLRYATRPLGGAWSTATVDSSATVGLSTSIGVDSAGGVHVVYQEASPLLQLKYAYLPPQGSWQTQVLDADGAITYETDLQVDSLDGVHIAYYETSPAALRYAFKPSGGDWSFDTIDSSAGVGGYVSLAVDDAGGVHAAYHDAALGDLLYAYSSCPNP